MGGQACHDLGNAQRLDDVVDAAARKALDDLLGFSQPGHEEHRHVRPRGRGLDAPAELEAAGPRHDRIEQDAVGHRDVESLHGLFGVAGDQYRIALADQGVAKHVQCVDGIVDDQDDVLRTGLRGRARRRHRIGCRDGSGFNRWIHGRGS